MASGWQKAEKTKNSNKMLAIEKELVYLWYRNNQ